MCSKAQTAESRWQKLYLNLKFLWDFWDFNDNNLMSRFVSFLSVLGIKPGASLMPSMTPPWATPWLLFSLGLDYSMLSLVTVLMITLLTHGNHSRSYEIQQGKFSVSSLIWYLIFKINSHDCPHLNDPRYP